MINTAYPTIQERQRPVAVSYEANFVRNNIETCHVLFVGQSVVVQEMYNQQLKKRFDFFNSIWKNETIFSSSISEITNNSAYRSIIGLGQDILPFIINDLKINDAHWFYALEALTGQNPIKEYHKGIVPLMKKDWIEWATNNNLTDEN
ncbi:hypothetical protein [Aquirufa salirivi]|uniref:Uncharacterized protein n=1 Tax=Aquirufa salirivi TaxID=3104729 RepID=A0ABW8RTB2_9BACT